MFGFAWCAACIPAQDDWLNDLSSTPPVSSTMHAFRLPVDELPPVPPLDVPVGWLWDLIWMLPEMMPCFTWLSLLCRSEGTSEAKSWYGARPVPLFFKPPM